MTAVSRSGRVTVPDAGAVHSLRQIHTLFDVSLYCFLGEIKERRGNSRRVQFVFVGCGCWGSGLILSSGQVVMAAGITS